MVLELNESVSVLEDDLPDPAVALEELFHVALAGAAGDVPQEDALVTTHHSGILRLVLET